MPLVSILSGKARPESHQSLFAKALVTTVTGLDELRVCAQAADVEALWDQVSLS